MSVVTLPSNTGQSKPLTKDEIKARARKSPYYKRKIRCPRHYLADPRKDPYLREPVAALRNVSNSAVKTYGVKKYRIKRDRYGRPMLNWSAYYQPQISASFAIEHVWDPKNHICQQCRRCMEGKGTIREMEIKRLHG